MKQYAPKVKQAKREAAAATTKDEAKAADHPLQRQQAQQIAQLRGQAPSASNGLPTQLKAGIEALSGLDMGGVKVHRNSAKPAQIQAHAYAQGQDIHLGPGQEKHLPHEAWHVVQQMQGRVNPNLQLKSGIHLNNNTNLEKEADSQSSKALQLKFSEKGGTFKKKSIHNHTLQLAKIYLSSPPNLIDTTHFTKNELENFIRQEQNLLIRSQLLTAISRSEYKNSNNYFKTSGPIKAFPLAFPVPRSNLTPAKKIHNKNNIPDKKERSITLPSEDIPPSKKFIHKLQPINKIKPLDKAEPIQPPSYPKRIFRLNTSPARSNSQDISHKTQGTHAKSPDIKPKNKLIATKSVWPRKIRSSSAISNQPVKNYPSIFDTTAPWHQKQMEAPGQVYNYEQRARQGRAEQPLGVLPFTHNTDAQGLYGILSTGQFLAGTESVNYRYDIDSRYHNGISIVMRPHMEWLWPDIFVQDLYDQLPTLSNNKEENFGGNDVKKQKIKLTPSEGKSQQDQSSSKRGRSKEKNHILAPVRKHFKNLDNLSNFRDQQVDEISKGSGSLTKRNPDNYKLSLVNPQIRIPKENPIGYSHIEFVIMTRDAYKKICDFFDNPKSAPTIAVNNFIKQRGGPKNQHLCANFFNGAKRFNELREQGKIKVIKGESGFSHNAGRLEKRSEIGKIKMEESARQGLEFGQEYHHAEENNSPAALDMKTMIQFQEIFYKVLASAQGHRAQSLAQDRLEQRKIWLERRNKSQLPIKNFVPPEESTQPTLKTLADLDKSRHQEKQNQIEQKPKISPEQAWAARHGGTAEYGSSDRNNCLIYAIALSLVGSEKVTSTWVSNIRKSINNQHLGAEKRGMLAPGGNIIQHILQLIMGDAYENGVSLPEVTVEIETVIKNVQPTKIGNSGIVINIFHDGTHYWWLKK